MPRQAALRRRPSGEGKTFTQEPLALRALLVTVVASTAVWSGFALAWLDGDLGAWARFVLLLVLAIGFEEGSRRVAQLQIRLSTQFRADMTSVWIVTGGISLAPGRSVLLIGALYLYMWFRQNRPAGARAHRKLYNGSSAILAALFAGWVAREVAALVDGFPAALSGAVPIVVGVVAAIVALRALITVALVAVGITGKALLGSVSDNLIELATPCLGGLVALAVEHQPWLAILVVLPLVTLQRGAVVRELEAAAITDAKTGLLNAVAWEQLAKRELERAYRAGTTVSVAILDIDRFKVVNDRFGHLVGDKVLASVARAVKESLRGYDGLGRFGGEEFVIVLPDSDQREALVVAERVRLRVNRLCVLDAVPELDDTTGRAAERLSVSIGVAVLNSDGAELQDLLHAADQALYRAKWNGRNQVQLARRGDQLPDTVAL